MTSILAACVFVVVIASFGLGVIGLLFVTTHDIRRTIKRGASDALDRRSPRA